VLGFGGDAGALEPGNGSLPSDSDRQSRGSYDRTSPLQVLGVGNLTEAQMQSLANEARRQAAQPSR
jgi:hypothetical protein